MTTKTKGQPGHKTLQRVQDQLSVIPRTAANIASAVELTPATTRKALTVLQDEGLATKHEDGTWVATQPAEGPTNGAEPKATKAKAATKKAKKAQQPERPTGTADKTANWLRDLGFSEKLAEQDGALVDCLRYHGPLREDEIFGKLGQFSTWSFRRMAEGQHGRLNFERQIEPVGRGDSRVWKVVG